MLLVHWQQTVLYAALLLVCFIFTILVSFPRPLPFVTNKKIKESQHVLHILLILVSAVFPLFGVQMYNKLGYQWATSVLAFLTVAMMPFPYLFFKYGKQIRAKSRFAKPK